MTTMDYKKLKKLDEVSLQKLKEGKGPSDKCICHLFYPEEGKKGFRNSMKKVFTSLGKVRSKKEYGQVVSPLKFSKGKVTGTLHTTKEIVKRPSSCGKCGCDQENIVLKHSIANIRIVSPDISSFCPCSEDCLPDKEKLKNNITVTVEHFKMADFEGPIRRSFSEPNMALKYSLLSMDDEKYDDYEYESSRDDSDDGEKYS